MAIQDEEFNLPILLGYWLCDCDPTARIEAAQTGIKYHRSPFSLPTVGLVFLYVLILIPGVSHLYVGFWSPLGTGSCEFAQSARRTERWEHKVRSLFEDNACTVEWAGNAYTFLARMKIDKPRLSSSLAIEIWEVHQKTGLWLKSLSAVLMFYEPRFYYPLVVLFRLICVKGEETLSSLACVDPFFLIGFGIDRQGFSEIAQGLASAIPLHPPSHEEHQITSVHIYTRYHSDPLF